MSDAENKEPKITFYTPAQIKILRKLAAMEDIDKRKTRLEAFCQSIGKNYATVYTKMMKLKTEDTPRPKAAKTYAEGTPKAKKQPSVAINRTMVRIPVSNAELTTSKAGHLELVLTILRV